MDGETIIAIVTAVSTMIVTVVTLILRSRVIDLTKEVKDLKVNISSAQALIHSQHETINKLVQQIQNVNQAAIARGLFTSDYPNPRE